MRRCLLAAVLIFAPVAAGEELRPSFVSEMRVPERATIRPLLEAACPGGVRMGTEKGRAVFGCGDVFYDEVPLRANKGYPWREDVAWRADGVLFGHFLSAASEDAIVSGGGLGVAGEFRFRSAGAGSGDDPTAVGGCVPGRGTRGDREGQRGVRVRRRFRR